MKKTNYKPSTSLKVFMCLVFVAFVFFPFSRMVLNINGEDITNVISSPMFVTAVKNSLLAAATTTVISVTLGLILAFCIQRTAIRFKAVFSVLLILPMLIPSISHGMGLIVLFGNNGIITNLFGLNDTIYGFIGTVTGSVLYSYPVAFVMLNDVLSYEDSSPYEAASVLGIPKFNRTLIITLPYLKKPLISAVFSVFTMVITDYGVPMMIGGKFTTLAVMMFQEVLGRLNFSKGSVIGLILLIPAIVSFVINVLFKSSGKLSYVTKPFENKPNKLKDGAAYIMCGIVLLCIFTLFGSFLLLSFTAKYPSDLSLTLTNVRKMLALGGSRNLSNSFVIAIIVSTVGVVMSFVTAYLTARMPSKLSHLLHLFSITSLAIPGIVLGLSYAMTFSGSFIYGTLAILILANLMHFFASPYLMMYNSLCKVNQNLEDVGATLGIGRFRLVLNVIVPSCKTTIFEVASYFFVNSMMTISAVSFLANFSTKPISLMIGQFEGQMLYECAAVVSLVILTVNMVIKGTVYYINRRAAK